MRSKKDRGITLIALAITIILMLILGGVVVSTFSRGNIIENSLSATEKAKIEGMKENIQLAITSRVVKEDGDVTIEQIIDELEKQGLVASGNSNSDNGQVKTSQDGYVYEIAQDSYGNWNVSYVGTGKVEETKITIETAVNTTGISNSVIITVNAKAKSGIKTLQMPNGEVKTYGSSNIDITESYEVNKNGTYSFIATNTKGDSITKNVEINNILEGIIQISAEPSTPTMNNVVVTVKWPSSKYATIQEISTDGGKGWSNYTGSQSQVTVSSNCTIKARVRNGNTEMKTATLEITNIDKNLPIVTAKQTSITIREGDSNDISSYFTVSKNGTAEISSIIYVDTSNNNAQVSNTNTLSVGTHTIKCTATKGTGATSNASMNVVVEKKDTTPPTIAITRKSGVPDFFEINVTSVSDDVEMPETPIYSYYARYESQTDADYVLKYRGPNTTYILNENSTYENQWEGGMYGDIVVKVEVTDAAGNIGKAIGKGQTAVTLCFVAGTQVLTENGMRNIEDIKIGDKVYSINIDTNQKELKKVISIFEGYANEVYEITINGEQIVATPKHKFYIIDKGWIKASELEEGDKVSAKDSELEIEKINHTYYEKRIPIYNLTVEDFHTYVITKYEILVHNASSWFEVECWWEPLN